MKHYLQPSLQLEPREIILHAGTNDVRDSSPRIVTTSALTQRFDEESVGRKVAECNKIIKSFCNQNGWGLVQHQNIHLIYHVLMVINYISVEKGIAILASNFVNHLTN